MRWKVYKTTSTVLAEAVCEYEKLVEAIQARGGVIVLVNFLGSQWVITAQEPDVAQLDS